MRAQEMEDKRFEALAIDNAAQHSAKVQAVMDSYDIHDAQFILTSISVASV